MWATARKGADFSMSAAEPGELRELVVIEDGGAGSLAHAKGKCERDASAKEGMDGLTRLRRTV